MAETTGRIFSTDADAVAVAEAQAATVDAENAAAGANASAALVAAAEDDARNFATAPTPFVSNADGLTYVSAKQQAALAASAVDAVTAEVDRVTEAVVDIVALRDEVVLLHAQVFDAVAVTTVGAGGSFAVAAPSSSQVYAARADIRTAPALAS